MTTTAEMLKKIRKLIKKGWDDTEIAIEVGKNRGTISKYRKQFEEEDKKKIQKALDKAKKKVQKSKKKEVNESQDEGRESQKTSQNREKTTNKNQIKHKEEVIFNSAEDKVRAMPGAIDDFIETEQLKGASKAEWEKRKQEIREILRVEVDKRIAGERQDALNTWWTNNSENYVTKEFSDAKEEEFTEEIETKDNRIKELEERDEQWQELLGKKKNAIDERDNAIISLQSDMTNLAEYNGELSGYIGLHIDDERERLRIWATSLDGKEESLKNKESEIEAYGKRQQDNLDKIYLANSKEAEKREGEVEIREKAVEKRGKQVDENQEKVGKIINGIKEEQRKLKREWTDLEKAVKKETQQLQDWRTRLEGWRLKNTKGFNKTSGSPIKLVGVE